MRSLSRWLLLLSLGALLPANAFAKKLSVLLIDGQNNHNWRATTPVLKEMLQKTGRFQVEVLTAPPGSSDDPAWSGFRPEFSRYDVVFSNYNGAEWPAVVRKSFEDYMTKGGGLVIYHAANNPFPKWDEWNKMVGLSWQGPDFGDRITVDDQGNVIRTPKGQGPGAGHGPQHPYLVVVRDRKRPVMKGMPAQWTHVADELYHGQRGPAINMTILATAFSDPNQGGTGANEPLVYTVSYGKGRIFVDLMGHDVPQTSAPDSVALLTRGAEWAATRKVTIPISKEWLASKP